MARLKVGILISGRGSNMRALLQAAADPAFPAEIVLVASNNPDAGGLAVAADQGIATAAVNHRKRSREDFEAELDATLRAAGVEFVCLAGFMRLLTAGFVEKWQGRMINIHPSLLPAFKGVHVHEQALAAGVRFSGCTVHFVVPAVDDGPIIVQAAVPVAQDDTPETLGARVLTAEHRIYPEALRWIAEGRVRAANGRVAIADVAGADGVLLNPPAPAWLGIASWHAHVYFDGASRDAAFALRATIADTFAGEVEVGRFHERPVGPHPCWSFQVAFAPGRFERVLPWLALHRDDLVVFVHPNTGDDLVDHRDRAIWLGDKLDLNLDALVPPPPHRWRNGWDAPKAPPMDYALVQGATAPWSATDADGFAHQDMGLARASHGLLDARRLRWTGADGAPAGDWRCHDADFDFLYVTDGSVVVEDETGKRRRLVKGGTFCLPPLFRHRFAALSADFTGVRITTPARFATFTGRDAPLPAHAKDLPALRQAIYRDDLPAAFAAGAGPRRFFTYRDLGPAAATAKRIHIHVVKSLGGEVPPGGTGWHHHSMSQWFMVLHGWATLAVEGQGETVMRAGDAMCLGAGMKHDVPAFSPDYAVLEMCLPTDYETAAVARPAA